MADQVDFTPLGNLEITSAKDIFEGCEIIRSVGSNAGLIVAQFAFDVEFALRGIQVIDPGRGLIQDNPAKRARRVARHLHRSAEALRAAALSAAKLPPAYLRTYADVIEGRKGRKAFNPTEGL
jgi:hypothetical protein